VLDFLVLELVDLFLALALKEASSEAEVTGFSARSLQHFSDSEPRDNFENADKDESISHHTLFNKSVVGGGRGESLTERVDNESIVNGNVSNNGHLADTAVPSYKGDKCVSRQTLIDLEHANRFIFSYLSSDSRR
jgi:hypothetical protein